MKSRPSTSQHCSTTPATACLNLFVTLEHLYDIVSGLSKPRSPRHALGCSVEFKPVQEKVPGLLRLPNELLFSILDEAPLYSKVLLSQTCRATRSSLHSVCVKSVKELSLMERAGFSTDIAFALPESWPCPACGLLHAREVRDTPSCPPYRYGLCPRMHVRPSSHDSSSNHKISHSHVDFALKLSRAEFAFESHRAYLAKLMASHRKFGSLESPVLVTYRAQSKIVGQRFILQSHWEYSPNVQLQLVKPEDVPDFTICPHLTFCRYYGSNRFPSNRLTRSISTAFSSMPVAQFGRCSRCPTDIQVQVENGRLKLWIWKDFGSGGSPWDLEWRVHLFDRNYNHCSKGPTVAHVPGSVKNMYLKNA